jgi:hypothetical protein
VRLPTRESTKFGTYEDRWERLLRTVSAHTEITLANPPPGGLSFSYTLVYHNANASTLSGSQLSLPIPANATFVSADGGGVKGTDGIVRWTPAPLAHGASGQVHLTLQNATTPAIQPAF